MSKTYSQEFLLSFTQSYLDLQSVVFCQNFVFLNGLNGIIVLVLNVSWL